MPQPERKQTEFEIPPSDVFMEKHEEEMEYFPNNITSEIEEPTNYKPNESHPSYYKMTTAEF